MNVYTVHLKGSPDDLAALERAEFVREGFSAAAFIFGPLWLLWNRLWLALVIWLATGGALAAWDVFGSPAPFAILALLMLMNAALGFEAGPLRRAGLAQRRFRTVGVVHGRRRLDAERSFFPGAVEVRRDAPEEASLRPGPPRSPGMVGLFPSTGA